MSELLYSLRIEGTEIQLEALKELQKGAAVLREEIKKLEKDGSAQAEGKKIQLQEQQKMYRDLQREVVNQNKAANDGIKTLQSMRASLASMNKEIEKLPVGGEAYKEMTAEATKLRAEINGLDQAQGKFQGNVGNYKNSIVSAFEAMGLNVGKLTGGIQQAGGAMQGFAGMSLAALGPIAVGVLAVGAAFKFVAAWAKSSAERQSELNKLTGIWAQTWEVIMSSMFKTADGQTKFFENVRGAWTAMLTQFLGQSAQVAAMLVDSVENKAEALRKKQNAAIVETAQLTERYEKFMTMAKDKAQYTDQQRLVWATQAADIYEQLTKKRIEAINQEIEFVKFKNDISAGSSAEDEKRIAELTAQRIAAQVELSKKERERFEVINGIMAKEDSLHTGIQAAIAKSTAELQKFILAQQVLMLQTEKMLMQLASGETDAARREKIAGQGRAGLAGQGLREEEGVDDILPDWAAAMNDAVLQELYIVRDVNGQIISSYKERFAALEHLVATGVITEEQAAFRKKQLEQEVLNTKLSAMTAGLDGMAAIAGEQSKLGKAAAVASALISTYQAANMAMVGPPGLPWSAVYAAAAVAMGLANVRKIISTQQPKFAGGVIGLAGAGTGTSDSIDARLSRGESVVTAKATRAFAPVLAEMERAVGNQPNFQIGRKRFAAGLIGQQLRPNTNIMQDYETIIQRTLQAVGSIPVVVSETDITATQSAVRKIRVAGDLV